MQKKNKQIEYVCDYVKCAKMAVGIFYRSIKEDCS